MHEEAIERRTSLGDAVGRVVEAGHRLVIDRVDLAVQQVNEVREQVAETMALIMTGAIAFTVAWIALNWALIVVLARHASMVPALLVSAALNVIVGTVLLIAGLRHRTGPALPGGNGRG